MSCDSFSSTSAKRSSKKSRYTAPSSFRSKLFCHQRLPARHSFPINVTLGFSGHVGADSRKIVAMSDALPEPSYRRSVSGLLVAENFPLAWDRRGRFDWTQISSTHAQTREGNNSLGLMFLFYVRLGDAREIEGSGGPRSLRGMQSTRSRVLSASGKTTSIP